MQISVLGSGSAGNSAVVFSEETRLLIDAGLSSRQLNRRLEAVGVDPAELDGILITHEHGDHVRGLDVFCRKVEAPLYCNAATREVMITGPLQEPKRWRIITTGGKFSIGDIEVQTFPVAHDATEPMGFTLRDHESSVGILSDVGYVTNIMRNHMRGLNTLFVEANYDGVLLQNDTKRPWSVKQRILSRHGHLSNDQTASLLGDIADENLHRVILGHLSQDCNEPQCAIDAMKQALRGRGRDHIPVICAGQAEPTACVPAVRGGRPMASPVEISAKVAEAVRSELAVSAKVEEREREPVISREPVGVPTQALEQAELFSF